MDCHQTICQTEVFSRLKFTRRIVLSENLEKRRFAGQDNIVRIIMNSSAVMMHEVNTDQVRNSHPTDVDCINSYLRL